MKERNELSTEGVYKNLLSTPQIGDRVKIKKGHEWNVSRSSNLHFPFLCLAWYIRAGCYGTITRQSFSPNRFSVELDYLYSRLLGFFLPCFKEEVTIIG